MRPPGWNELLDGSNGLTRPAQVKRLISPQKLEVYLALFGRVLEKFMRRGRASEGMKLFVDGRRDPARLNTVMTDPPHDREPLADWAARVFGDRTFGMVLTYLENYDNDLTRTVAQDIAPLLLRTGLPLRGLDILLFMGNYGFTPFGVHKDNPGEEGFLFHIGPGVKTFYIWETERFLELSEGKEFYARPEEILADATRYELEPGDLMFFPSGTYHVADTPDFSASMVLDFLRPSPSDFKRLIAERMAAGMASAAGAAVADRHLPLFPEPFAPDEIGALTASLAFETDLNDAVEDYLLVLRSNAGFYNRSVINTDLQSAMPGSVLRGVPPFPILHRTGRREGLTEIYARGHHRAFPAHPELPGILKGLNEGEGITMEELRSRLAPEWESPDVIALVSALRNADAVTIE